MVTVTVRQEAYLALHVRLGSQTLQAPLTSPPLLTVTPGTPESIPFITMITHSRSLIGTNQWTSRALELPPTLTT